MLEAALSDEVHLTMRPSTENSVARHLAAALLPVGKGRGRCVRREGRFGDRRACRLFARRPSSAMMVKITGAGCLVGGDRAINDHAALAEWRLVIVVWFCREHHAVPASRRASEIAEAVVRRPRPLAQRWRCSMLNGTPSSPPTRWLRTGNAILLRKPTDRNVSWLISSRTIKSYTKYISFVAET